MPPTLVTIIIVVCLTALTAWWNIQIRFAASKEEAMKMWKRAVYIIFNIVGLIIQIWLFVPMASSKEPLTRGAVVAMIIMAGCIFSNIIVIFINWQIWDIYRLMLDGVKIHEKHFDKHLGFTEDLLKRVDSLEANGLQTPKHIRF